MLPHMRALYTPQRAAQQPVILWNVLLYSPLKWCLVVISPPPSPYLSSRRIPSILPPSQKLLFNISNTKCGRRYFSWQIPHDLPIAKMWSFFPPPSPFSRFFYSKRPCFSNFSLLLYWISFRKNNFYGYIEGMTCPVILVVFFSCLFAYFMDLRLNVTEVRIFRFFILIIFFISCIMISMNITMFSSLFYDKLYIIFKLQVSSSYSLPLDYIYFLQSFEIFLLLIKWL